MQKVWYILTKKVAVFSKTKIYLHGKQIRNRSIAKCNLHLNKKPRIKKKTVETDFEKMHRVRSDFKMKSCPNVSKSCPKSIGGSFYFEVVFFKLVQKLH